MSKEGLLFSEFVLPPQYDYEVEHARSIRPERNLLAAMLGRAICDAFGTAKCERHLVRNARHWLMGPLQPKKPFTFAWVCSYLDLDPISLQNCLKESEKKPHIMAEKIAMLRA